MTSDFAARKSEVMFGNGVAKTGILDRNGLVKPTGANVRSSVMKRFADVLPLFYPLLVLHRLFLQLDKFRHLKGHGGHAISNNFRPVQELHGRVVKLYSWLEQHQVCEVVFLIWVAPNLCYLIFLLLVACSALAKTWWNLPWWMRIYPTA